AYRHSRRHYVELMESHSLGVTCGGLALFCSSRHWVGLGTGAVYQETESSQRSGSPQSDGSSARALGERCSFHLHRSENMFEFLRRILQEPEGIPRILLGYFHHGTDG